MSEIPQLSVTYSGDYQQRRLVAIVQADPEPVYLVEIGYFETTRSWLLASEWNAWIKRTGAQAWRKPTP